MLKIKGRASGKEWSFSTKDTEPQVTLLQFLNTNTNLPIASSCSGKGLCKKCVTSCGLLSCTVDIKDVENDLEFGFDYL